MNKLHRYQISLYGMLIGALALLISIFHFNFGSYPIKPPLEVRVAEKISSIKNGVLAGLKDKEPPVLIEKHTVFIDNVLNSFGIGLSIGALILAFIGGVRKENSWSVRGALFFGGGALAFHAILFGIGLFLFIIVLITVSWVLLSFLQL